MPNMHADSYLEVGLPPTQRACRIPSGGLSEAISGHSAWLAYFPMYVKEQFDFDHSSEDLRRVRLSYEMKRANVLQALLLAVVAVQLGCSHSQAGHQCQYKPPDISEVRTELQACTARRPCLLPSYSEA